MSSRVHFQSSLSVEIQLNENTRKIQLDNLPANIKIKDLREKIFKELELSDESCYKLLFSQTQKSLSKRNIQQIFQGQEGHAILKKEVGEESVLMNSEKPDSASSSSSEKTEKPESEKSLPFVPPSSTDKPVQENPETKDSRTPRLLRSFVQMSNREKRNVGVIFALALLVLAYSIRRYFCGNVKPKTNPQEFPKATPQKI